MSELAQPKRVIIVGGGVQGAMIAHDLTATGHHVEIVEAAPSLGVWRAR